MENTNKDNSKLETAYFAWGCFWCIEWIMNHQKGVIKTTSWYIWDDKQKPNYELVHSNITDYREWVKVIFDSEVLTYKELLDIFWRQIDPIDSWWQFFDRWHHTTTAIYYTSDLQKKEAINSKQKLEDSWKFDEKIATKIEEFTKFYEAEDYHQNYSEKSPFSYKMYRKGSGREDYLKNTWWEETKKQEEYLKKSLAPIQYEVTQEWWTERAFNNEYYDTEEDWIYVDIVDGTPLFSSRDKYNSWCGWPSFTKPIDSYRIDEHEDNKLLMSRTEVRSREADSHLWHVFPDWPKDKGWLRYCINSAALKFVPVDVMEEEWYWKYLYLFD